jgi:hypothetical protein
LALGIGAGAATAVLLSKKNQNKKKVDVALDLLENTSNENKIENDKKIVDELESEIFKKQEEYLIKRND